MTWLARLNKPWLHFIVLGIVLYKLQTMLFPEPKPVIGPLNEARVEALQQQWFASAGRFRSALKQRRLSRVSRDQRTRPSYFAKSISGWWRTWDAHCGCRQRWR